MKAASAVEFDVHQIENGKVGLEVELTTKTEIQLVLLEYKVVHLMASCDSLVSDNEHKL